MAQNGHHNNDSWHMVEATNFNTPLLYWNKNYSNAGLYQNPQDIWLSSDFPSRLKNN